MNRRLGLLSLVLLLTARGKIEVGLEMPGTPGQPTEVAVMAGTATGTNPAAATPAEARAATNTPPPTSGSASPTEAPTTDTRVPSAAAPSAASPTGAAEGETPRPTATAFTASATLGSVNAATATATPSTAGLPEMWFGASPANLQPGQEVNLQWGTDAQVSGTVAIALMADDGARPTYAYWRDLPPIGSLSVKMDQDPRGRYLFVLQPSFASNPPYYELAIRLPCPDRFFFAMPANWQDLAALSRAHCPDGPPAFPAALEQAFEGGRLLWLQSDGRILVLYDDDYSWAAYNDTWTVAEPEADASLVVPEGRYQPARGFGKVWRENLDVRQRLGWALTPGQGFTSADQYDYVMPGTDMAQYHFVQMLDGSLVGLTTFAGHGVGGLRPVWQVIVGP